MELLKEGFKNISKKEALCYCGEFFIVLAVTFIFYLVIVAAFNW